MTTYTTTYSSGQNPAVDLEEHMLYGSSRLGLESVGQAMAYIEVVSPTTPTITNYYQGNVTGDKRFELSNHLGNVLQVVTDHKLPVDDTDNHIGYFLADVVSYSDYYPYGVVLPGDRLLQGRLHNGAPDNYEAANGSSASYRYGFQGQEKDDEIKGQPGNSINYKYRMHDPRIGRFFAVDPLASKYPHYTPYQFSGNKVIAWKELEGLEETGGDQGSVGPYKTYDFSYDDSDDVKYENRNIPKYLRRKGLFRIEEHYCATCGETKKHTALNTESGNYREGETVSNNFTSATEMDYEDDTSTKDYFLALGGSEGGTLNYTSKLLYTEGTNDVQITEDAIIHTQTSQVTVVNFDFAWNKTKVGNVTTYEVTKTEIQKIHYDDVKGFSYLGEASYSRQVKKSNEIVQEFDAIQSSLSSDLIKTINKVQKANKSAFKSYWDGVAASAAKNIHDTDQYMMEHYD